jgi:hypothetical protein
MMMNSSQRLMASCEVKSISPAVAPVNASSWLNSFELAMMIRIVAVVKAAPKHA